jgi:hypothetical protein
VGAVEALVVLLWGVATTEAARVPSELGVGVFVAIVFVELVIGDRPRVLAGDTLPVLI